MENNIIEKRNINGEFRALEDGRTVEGYAIVFNSESRDLGGFVEIIEPSAVDNEVIGTSDVFALLNHERERGILARSKYGKGSLKLDIDEHGLKYTFETPKTALGDELLEYLKRGDITTSSFCFCVENDKWERLNDGSYKRTISKIKSLHDVSPVYCEAYAATTVNKRGMEDLMAKEMEDLTDYYNELKKQIG